MDDKQSAPTKTPEPDKPDRRKLFRRVGTAVFGVVIGESLLQSRTLQSAEAIRPPGALAEPKFDSSCIRCGLCVEDCPYDILKLANWAEPVATGTPFFTARQEPCRMCPDIPCVKACPTGALDPTLTDIRKADMGVAVLVGHETCLNYKGLTCSICWRVCPIREEAIYIKPVRTNQGILQIPTVVSDKCTGCGTCEKHCVLAETAIRVLPRKLGLGQPGRNAAGRT